MKEGILTMVGLLGGGIAALLGGWDASLMTLICFMAADYITGLVVAGVFHNSGKSENGTLESHAGFKGLCRKGMTLLIVLVAAQLDGVIGSSFIRDAVVIAFIANETISLVENAGLMGVPVPAAIIKAIDVLNKVNSPGAPNGVWGREDPLGDGTGGGETPRNDQQAEK